MLLGPVQVDAMSGNPETRKVLLNEAMTDLLEYESVES